MGDSQYSLLEKLSEKSKADDDEGLGWGTKAALGVGTLGAIGTGIALPLLLRGKKGASHAGDAYKKAKATASDAAKAQQERVRQAKEQTKKANEPYEKAQQAQADYEKARQARVHQERAGYEQEQARQEQARQEQARQEQARQERERQERARQERQRQADEERRRQEDERQRQRYNQGQQQQTADEKQQQRQQRQQEWASSGGKAEDFNGFGINWNTGQATAGFSTKAEVKKAYRNMMMKWHPDRFVDKTPAGQAKATKMSQNITSMYEEIQRMPWYEKLAQLSIHSTRTALMRARKLRSID